MKKKTFGVISSITVFTLLVSACSSSTTDPEQAGSFSAAVSPTVNQDKIVTITSETTNKEGNGVTNAPAAESSRKDANSPQAEEAENLAPNRQQNAPEANAAASTTIIEPKAVVDGGKMDQKPSAASSSSETLTPSEQSQKAAAAPSKAADSAASPSNTKVSNTPQSKSTDSPTKTDSSSKTSTSPQKKEWSHTLEWSEFFDNEAQNTPSDKFWDLQGETVTINGYMGEVLSFDKNWFLLIPAPGAECPFDNGDETYWNKIMMVFVPSDSKLRYTSNPIELKGSLDVGIKIDESGYKTMFRIYDAQITEITE